MGEYITLREYINARNQINTIKINTFCRLMRKVSQAIDNCNINEIPIKINLDNIKINTTSGQIKFDSLLKIDDNMDKTMVDIHTGVSVMTDRKATTEHKNISFALMFLGWYVNNDESSVPNDLMVLENFDEYMARVPKWLHEFFISIFKKMNYETSFNEYYTKYFNNVISNEIKGAAETMGLQGNQIEKFGKLVMANVKDINKGSE